MKQVTKEEAIELAKSGFWKEMTNKEIAMFQLFQSKLCMDFDIFHEAVEKSLGRSVYIQEFANVELLQQELLGNKLAPTLKDIINMIPEDKRVIISVKGK